MEKTKDARIKQEYRRLKKIFQRVDPNKLKAADTLLQRAAFLTVSIKDIEDELNENGWTEEYHNGLNQTGMKKSAAADVHISNVKNLNSVMKQLLELCPPAEQEETRLDAFMRDFG